MRGVSRRRSGCCFVGATLILRAAREPIVHGPPCILRAKLLPFGQDLLLRSARSCGRRSRRRRCIGPRNCPRSRLPNGAQRIRDMLARRAQCGHWRAPWPQLIGLGSTQVPKQPAVRGGARAHPTTSARCVVELDDSSRFGGTC